MVVFISYVCSSVNLIGFENFCIVTGQVTNYFITSNSRSCLGLALTFIGGIFCISLTVSVSLTRSIGAVDVVRATDIIVSVLFIDVRSIGTVADV